MRLLALALLSASLLVFGCSPGGGGGGETGGETGEGARDRPPAASSQTRDLLLALTADRASYSRGTSVHLSLTLENQGAEPVVINWNSGQHFDIVIEDASGKEVYRWSRGMAFTQALEERTLEPGRSDRLEAVWDQKDSEGKQVDSGAYKVSGRSTSTPAPPQTSLSIQIESK